MANSPCVVNVENDLGEMDGITRETDVSLDEMMSLACRQGKLDIVELLLESGARVDYRNKAGNTPLLEACSQGHIDVAQYLLDHGADIDAATETTSDSALTWACTLGNESIVELLLSRKSNVEHRTKDGCTALMFAALAGHVKVASMLLDFQANINVESDSNKDSPLTFACWKGHVDVVILLLERNANIEHRTKEGFTPLMFSALGGHTAVAKKLLERHAKVNEPSGSNNDIPLTSACWKGHHEVVKLLLEHKSNIEHRTKDGCTPLMLAAREGHLIVAQLILDSGALVNVPSGSENNIPLTLACWKGHTDVVELLLNRNSDSEHRNKAGCTPLMLAAREGHLATTKLLLSRGAEVNTPSGSNDDTPLTLACWKGHYEVVELLLEHNSSVDHQTKTGCTPLMEATREGHVKVVRLLLENGADVELPDNYGQSPLFMACWKGHRDVAELLLKCNANRECRTKTGITPLFQACRENHVSVVELLLDQGASVSASFPNSRENPMTLAAEKGYVELMDVLLNRGGNVDCRTKKGCSPFFLACKEGHLEIARSLHKNRADIEVCDQRNISPLVAAFRNGHHKVVEWILSITKHVPSDEQCQKCITAPLEGKDNERDLLYLRTACYEMIKKAKKVKEQAAFQHAQSFLQELEEDKVREENKKKRQAAKRRDKRKKKKKQRESERGNPSNIDILPSENRPCNVNDNHEEDNTCSEEETSRVSNSDINNSERNRREETAHEVIELNHMTQCRAKTVGQARDEKENTNSTEERRDDQPQAVFDVADQQEVTSPKKAEETTKSAIDCENNKRHSSASGYSGKSNQRHRSQNINPEPVVQSPTSMKDGEQFLSQQMESVAVEKSSSLHTNMKVKQSESMDVSGTELTSRGNMVKNSGNSLSSNSDAYFKENGRVHVSRMKQASFDFLNCWKEVTRNSSSKTMVIQLTAPNALCGRVIGRGGTKINGITDESGAQITIGKPDPKTSNDRVITIKGSVKAVQKAKLLVSQALNTPSGIAQTQTPNLSSSAVSSHVLSQSISSAAPIRGNFAAIPSSSVEWPTVAQANRLGSVKEPSTSTKNPENKAVSVSEPGNQKADGDARETRAHSAPDLNCEPLNTHNAAGPRVWSVDTRTNVSASYTVSSSVAEGGSFVRLTSTAGRNSSNASSTTKPQAKSSALTLDVGSRLSYCEVATGIENGSGKLEDTKKVNSPSSTTIYRNVVSSPSNGSDPVLSCGTGYVEESDNVFADDCNFPETGKTSERLDVDEENVPIKEQIVSGNPWAGSTREHENVVQSSPQSTGNESSGPQSASLFTHSQSASLFTGTPWSNRERDDSDKTRSISWSGQDYSEPRELVSRDDYQSSQSDINSLSSHSIWSPVQPKSSSVGAVCDGDPVESTGWDNSNSASSSRSSSRLELSSIMENEKNATTSPFPQTSPPDTRENNGIDLMDESTTDLEYQNSWLPTRGAHSAPSSPSLVRSRDQRLKVTRPITAQPNSYDDMSDRLWSRPANEDSSDADTNWNANVAHTSSGSSVYQNHVNNVGDHADVLKSSQKLGSFKQYPETAGVNKWRNPLFDPAAIADVLRLLERLSLTKYKQTFEENYITMDKLVNMTDTDLTKIGVPKGPRLKIMHAVQRDNNGMTNGPVPHNISVSEHSSSGVPTPDVLGRLQGSGTLLNHMHIDPNSRVPTQTSFAPVMPTAPQVLQKQPTETALNPMMFPYPTNSSAVPHPHSLLSLDPGVPAPTQPGRLEQPMNGLPPQQQFMLPTVHNDQYDPQNSYIGAVPYQQQVFYPRPPGAYYFYH